MLNYGIDSIVYSDGDLPAVLSDVKRILSMTIIHGGILKGFYYIPVGMFLHRIKIPGMITKTAMIGGFLLLCHANSLIVEYVMIVIASIGLFCEIRRIPLKDSRIYPCLRKMSTVVYFAHMYIAVLYGYAVNGTYTYGLRCFLATVVISYSAAFLYTKNKQYR